MDIVVNEIIYDSEFLQTFIDASLARGYRPAVS